MKERPRSSKTKRDKTKQKPSSRKPRSKPNDLPSDREDSFVVGTTSGPLSGYYKAHRRSAPYKEQREELGKKAKRLATLLKGRTPSSRGPRLNVRCSSKKAAIPTSRNFDWDCVPVYNPTRRARRGMVRDLIICSEDKLFYIKPDPFMVQEFKRQEAEDLIHRQLLVDAFGKKANWRDSLIHGARSNRLDKAEEDKAELASLMADAAVNGNQRELHEFLSATKRVQLAIKKSTKHKSKFSFSRWVATVFALRIRELEKRMPTRAEVEHYLKKEGLPVPPSRTAKRQETGSNSQRLFVGPFLSQIPKAKPWEFEKKRRAGRLPIK